ncbi:hypothetical protein KA005_27510 [bacterium]|nr:hypothetical protein [bacterium]
MTTKECHKRRCKQPSSIVNLSRKVLRKYNFITVQKLARLLKIKGQAASRILVDLPEWNKYSARSWAREGYPL